MKTLNLDDADARLLIKSLREQAKVSHALGDRLENHALNIETQLEGYAVFKSAQGAPAVHEQIDLGSVQQRLKREESEGRWRVVNCKLGEPLPTEQIFEFTELFFKHCRPEQFTRVHTPVFEPKPGLNFTVRSLRGELAVEVEEDGADLNHSERLAAALAFALAAHLADLKQHYILQLAIHRPVIFETERRLVSKRYHFYGRTARGLKPEEAAS